MNYSRIYNELISRAKTREIKGYKERHHIVPRCMGGTDDPDNLVDLTAREHYIAHRLLVQINPSNSGLMFALHFMSNLGIEKSRWYERDRINHAKFVSKTMKGLWAKNRDKWSKIIAETNSNRDHSKINKNISLALKEYYAKNPVTNAARLKNSLAQKARFKERPQTEEERIKRKEALRRTTGRSIIALQNNEIRYAFGSGAEAKEVLNLSNTQQIYTCCKRREKKDYPYSSFGYIWMYSYCELQNESGV